MVTLKRFLDESFQSKVIYAVLKAYGFIMITDGHIGLTRSAKGASYDTSPKIDADT